MLEKEFHFYLKSQKELLEKHRGKFLVIKGEEVIGIYDTEIEAYEKTLKQGHELGTFLIQLCEPGVENYTQTFHSRVSI